MKKRIFPLCLLAFIILVSSCKNEDEVIPPPTITSFTPNNGVSTATVTITGTNFSATPADNVVKFNGTAATVTASTATTLTATVPAGATSGTISVTVKDQSVTSTDNFRVDLLFKATMNKNDEPASPVNTSTGTGTTLLIYNTDAKTFSLTVTYTGLTAAATNSHIHKGVAGVSGPVVFPFASPFTSPILYTSAVLTADQQTDLMAGNYYVNVHTSTYTGGEIRGALIKQ
ncbi:MAG TPA: CHRD domain-containing protein [Cyclobacteriaceae bacterium]|nr:CHRD domain-containing protein [Cyclobacteriaceae bacterium]